MENVKKFYYENGNTISEFWYKNNKCHRDNGPAIIYYNENQNIINEEYYLNGKKVDELVVLVNKE